MRIFSKDTMISRLSLPKIISRSNNTFFVICIDNFTLYKTLSMTFELKHSSNTKMFNFTDTYFCFSGNKTFFHYLNICKNHLSYNSDGSNAMLAFVYEGNFVNFFNPIVINSLVERFKYSLDFENYLLQLIITIVFFIELFLFSLMDLLFLDIEDDLFSF